MNANLVRRGEEIGAGAPEPMLVGEREGKLYPLDPCSVDFVESEGNYVRYNVGRVSFTARGTLERLSDMLRPAGFVRIERSLLLNLRSISFVERGVGRRFLFTLRSGTRLRSGARYRESILLALPLPRRAVGPPSRAFTANRSSRGSRRH